MAGRRQAYECFPPSTPAKPDRVAHRLRQPGRHVRAADAGRPARHRQPARGAGCRALLSGSARGSGGLRVGGVGGEPANGPQGRLGGVRTTGDRASGRRLDRHHHRGDGGNLRAVGAPSIVRHALRTRGSRHWKVELRTTLSRQQRKTSSLATGITTQRQRTSAR